MEDSTNLSSEDLRRAASEAFKNAVSNGSILDARFEVLDGAQDTLTKIADHCQLSGWAVRESEELAVAILARIAGELSGGIALLLRNSHAYGAGALLRQLIEVEYLMYLGYLDPANLERWYKADGRELRNSFTPQRMREAAGGLFRNEEYWQHCEVGGHPHHNSRMLLSNYKHTVEPSSFLLPDAVQHIRRLWTSLKLLLPKLGFGEFLPQELLASLDKSIKVWTKVEDPLVLSFDGIQKGTDLGDTE